MGKMRGEFCMNDIETKAREIGSKIDDEIEKIAAEKKVPKWAVWLALAVALGVALFGVI
jgi:hypothetical protein